jgi:hypothetical protein
MPRMLPSNIYDGCPSPGERELFAILKNDRGIDSWTILHSLDLADHIRQVSGEADSQGTSTVLSGDDLKSKLGSVPA